MFFQFRNAIKNERAGNALSIKFSDITAETLSLKLHELLTNPIYTKKAQELSKVFQDLPLHPMDNAMFHIEYVMRHKGAQYLKSSANELSWYQHLLFDVLLVFLAAAFVVAITLRFVFKSVLRLVCGSRPQAKLKSS